MWSRVRELHGGFWEMPQPWGLLKSDCTMAWDLCRAGKGLDTGHVVLQRLGALAGLGRWRVGRQVLKRLSNGGQKRRGDQQPPAFHAAGGKKHRNITHRFYVSNFQSFSAGAFLNINKVSCSSVTDFLFCFVPFNIPLYSMSKENELNYNLKLRNFEI